jgi:hypothetical protein
MRQQKMSVAKAADIAAKATAAGASAVFSPFIPAAPAVAAHALSSEDSRRAFAARVMEDPSTYMSSRAPAPAPAAVAAPSGTRSLAGGGTRQPQDQIAVQDVKWLWEPDDGAHRWVAYDPLLCQTIERQFQLWILATSEICAVCTARRRHEPPPADAARGFFTHSFAPGVMWKFSFTVNRAGAYMFTQVSVVCLRLAVVTTLTRVAGKHRNGIKTWRRS